MKFVSEKVKDFTHPCCKGTLEPWKQECSGWSNLKWGRHYDASNDITRPCTNMECTNSLKGNTDGIKDAGELKHGSGNRLLWSGTRMITVVLERDWGWQKRTRETQIWEGFWVGTLCWLPVRCFTVPDTKLWGVYKQWLIMCFGAREESLRGRNYSIYWVSPLYLTLFWMLHVTSLDFFLTTSNQMQWTPASHFTHIKYLDLSKDDGFKLSSPLSFCLSFIVISGVFPC